MSTTASGHNVNASAAESGSPAEQSASADTLLIEGGESATSSQPITLDVSSQKAVKLDALGPMVVNKDGTLSRIANWQILTEHERKNTLRVLSARNK
ncbi:hypothetical protein BKA70DRAFT_1098266 [Coprinopsis sp. MPI-PUGE-AT-0042]|nr:hypothetical protein BKA70DRAFT_1098266 [Coprinopsis sp. MPI-PUGE-AT-0042]